MTRRADQSTTPDALPWVHESGSRHAQDYEAPAGVVIWTPRTPEQIEKEQS